MFGTLTSLNSDTSEEATESNALGIRQSSESLNIANASERHADGGQVAGNNKRRSGRVQIDKQLVCCRTNARVEATPDLKSWITKQFSTSQARQDDYTNLRQSASSAQQSPAPGRWMPDGSKTCLTAHDAEGRWWPRSTSRRCAKTVVISIYRGRENTEDVLWSSLSFAFQEERELMRVDPGAFRHCNSERSTGL